MKAYFMNGQKYQVNNSTLEIRLHFNSQTLQERGQRKQGKIAEIAQILN